MLKTVLAVSLILTLLLVPLAGCTSESPVPTSSTSHDNTQNPTIEVDLMANIRTAPLSGSVDFSDSEIQSIHQFSIHLLQQAVQNEGNVMISPASVFLALAMTLNGADTTTRDAMLQTLTDGQLSVEQVNTVSRSWLKYLGQTAENTTLKVANSIWLRESFMPYEPFLQANADYFQADAQKLDFSNQAAADTINHWIDEATNGLIDQLIEKINPSTVMFLINTIYFKSDWQTPFEPAETYDQAFQTPSETLTIPFMHQTTPIVSFDISDAAGMMLPYDDGQFAYFAILPDQSLTPRDWLNKQNPDELLSTLHTAMMDHEATPIHLGLPIYKAEFEDSLNDDLDQMGMGIAFQGQADFSKMNADRSKGLYISEVKHKTVISVDEKGTEAAAATSVAIDESAVFYEKELIFDRPFLYGIIDLNYGLPLFIGILENPATDQ